MASKQECPSCRKVLKEKGDECKNAHGEYEVIEGSFRQIKCLECGYQNTANFWCDCELFRLTKNL